LTARFSMQRMCVTTVEPDENRVIVSRIESLPPRVLSSSGAGPVIASSWSASYANRAMAMSSLINRHAARACRSASTAPRGAPDDPRRGRHMRARIAKTSSHSTNRPCGSAMRIAQKEADVDFDATDVGCVVIVDPSRLRARGP
jgi:hypothetical protein